MTIYDNVAYGPRRHGIKDKKVLDEIVERSLQAGGDLGRGQGRLQSKSGLALSGGQQQRLCIARTLATDPEVMLMDEPASALDPLSHAAIEELIDELRENYTIVIVTHNMQQASRMSQRTAFFTLGDDRAGYLVEVGTDGQHLHQSTRATDRRLCLRPVRLGASHGRSDKTGQTPSGEDLARPAGSP